MNQTKLLALVVLASFFIAAIPVVAEETAAPQTLRERYIAAKTSYVQTKQAYLNAVQDWQNFKQAFRNRDRQAFLKAQNFLDKGTKHLIQYLNVLSKKVEETKALSAEKQTALTTELSGYIATLETDQAQINNASTVEEIRAATNKTKVDWDTIRPQVKRIIGEVLLAKAELIVARADNASAKVDAKIADLKSKGKDTADLEAKNAEFKSRIASAKDKLAQAKAKLADVKTGDATVNLRAADQFIREANRSLRDMYASLGQIIHDIRLVETGKSEPLPANTTELSETPVSPEEAS
jgi:hypothetical protein